MLEMTPRAATLLSDLRRESEIPNEAGVRVYSEKNEEGQPTVAIAFAADPMPGDEIAETDGIRLFVSREVAEPLSEAVIDVTGDDGASQLVFRPREEPAQN